MRTSWLRVRTPVFSKSCCSTAFTELSEIDSRAPISLLVSPSNTPLSTACSRCVNPCARGIAVLPVAAAMMERVTAGSSQTSPATTFRMASTRRLGGTVLEKDAGGTVFQSAQHHRVAHAGGYQENMAGEAAAACPVDKLRSLLVAEIVIQQNDVDLRQMRQGERFGRGGAGGHDLEVRLGLKKPAEALAEQAVIVDQHYPNLAAHSYHSCSRAARVTTPRRTSSPRSPVRSASRL